MPASNGPTGKKPKNAFTDPSSPFWQYAFQFKGRRDSGSTGCRTGVEAGQWIEQRKVAFRAQVEAEAAGETSPKAKAKITVGEACQRWEDDKHPHTEAEKANPTLKSWKTERPQLAMLTALLGVEKRLCDITASDLIAYRLTRSRHSNGRGGTINHASINREIELARRVWRYVVELGFETGTEPVWRKYLDRGAETVRKTELRPDDEANLLAALTKRHPELSLIVEFSILSGQRKAQVCLLKRANVDLKGKRMTVYLKRKGTALEPHTIPLTHRMVKILEAFPQVESTDQWFTYACRRAAPARSDRPARIASARYPFSKQGWQRVWKLALKDAGIEDFRYHDLRHTAASRLVRKTPNLAIAQRMLGHSDIATTARYAHVSDDDLMAAMMAVAA